MSVLSLLGAQRPDIWSRAIELAHATTGMWYPHKAPLLDGTIYACGGSPYYRREPQDERLRREIAEIDEKLEKYRDYPEYCRRLHEQREQLKKELEDIGDGAEALAAYVPDGCMEWLLHEVGHWVAASAAERVLPNYGLTDSEIGHGGDRELQAWAFEEIVLQPWGYAREFAAPTMRDGAGFRRAGPIEQRHLRHIERRLAQAQIELEPWRIVWGEWIRWGRALKYRAPWRSVQ